MEKLDNLWRVVRIQHHDACLDIPAKFGWGNASFVTGWLRLKGLINSYEEYQLTKHFIEALCLLRATLSVNI